MQRYHRVLIENLSIAPVECRAQNELLNKRLKRSHLFTKKLLTKMFQRYTHTKSGVHECVYECRSISNDLLNSSSPHFFVTGFPPGPKVA